MAGVRGRAAMYSTLRSRRLTGRLRVHAGGCLRLAAGTASFGVLPEARLAWGGLTIGLLADSLLNNGLYAREEHHVQD